MPGSGDGGRLSTYDCKASWVFEGECEECAAVSRAGCVGYGCQEGAVGFLWLSALPPLFSFFLVLSGFRESAQSLISGFCFPIYLFCGLQFFTFFKTLGTFAPRGQGFI